MIAAAEDSSCVAPLPALPCLVAGRPAAYVPRLDHGGCDLHRFVARGLIYPMDGSMRLEPREMLRFYRAATWLPVLRDFANIDEDAATVAGRAAEVMRELATSRSTATASSSSTEKSMSAVASNTS